MDSIGNFIESSIDLFEKDNRYMKLFFSHLIHFYTERRKKQDDFKGLSITYATKAIANIVFDFDNECFPSIKNTPNLHGMVVSIQPKDESLPSYNFREFIRTLTKKSIDKDEHWQLLEEGRNAFLNIKGSYNFREEKEELKPQDNFFLKKFAEIYSSLEMSDLNILITCRTFKHTLQCVIFNIWDWYHHHFRPFLRNEIPKGENECVNLFDNEEISKSKDFVIFDQKLNLFRLNLTNMAKHIKFAEEKLTLFESEKRKQLINKLVNSEEFDYDFLRIIIKKFDLNHKIPETTQNIISLTKDLQELTSLIRSICSYLRIKAKNEKNEINQTYLEKSREQIEDHKKRKELIKYINYFINKFIIPRTYQHNIIKYIDSFNNSEDTSRKGFFENITSIIETIFKQIKEVNKPYPLNFIAIEENFDFKLMEKEIDLSEQRSKDPILFIKNIAKQICRIKSCNYRRNLIQTYINIVLERTPNFTLIIEESAKLLKNQGVYIDYSIRNSSENLHHFGKKNLIRWVILDKETKTGKQEEINSIEFKSFAIKMKNQNYDYGLFIYDGKRQQYFDKDYRGKMEIRYDLLASIDIIQDKPAFNFNRIHSILIKNETKELLNLLLYFKEKIDKKLNSDYIETMKSIIRKKINSTKTKELFDKILNQDDPYGLIKDYEDIHNDMINKDVNRHDLIHVLNVLEKSLVILEILYENQSEIQSNQSLKLDFYKDLEYDDLQTAFVIASLWHDLGYKEGRSHAIKSLYFFNLVSSDLLNFLYGSINNKAKIVKELIEILIVCHTKDVSDYNFEALSGEGFKINNKIKEIKCNSFLEACIFRFADVLDTTYIRQTSEYLQNLYEKNLDISDEANERDVLQHQLSILSIDEVLIYIIEENDKKLLKIEIIEDIFEDYQPLSVSNEEFRYLQTKYFSSIARWSYLQPKIGIIGKYLELFTIYIAGKKFA